MADSQTPPPAPDLDVRQIPPPSDVAQPPADAEWAGPAGKAGVLASRRLSAGSSQLHPGPADIVTVNYTAWTSDGVTIDASSSRGEPSVWAVDRLMPGLRQGIPLMAIGEKRRLWIPRELAHAWAPGTLVFDVELISTAPPPDAPTREEFSTPPADAHRTRTALAWKILRQGHGTERPKPMATVTIHYTGWTADRLMFDDSVARKAPLTVAVDTVMPGLAEALQLMVVGEKTRFWIPAELAFTPPGPPLSALVVDVELLAVQHAAPGAHGSVEVRTNSPDAKYVLVQPDGTPLPGKGSHVFADAVPGNYRIKPDRMKSYAVGVVATPRDMILAPAGSLTITITYRPIIQ